MDRSTRLQKAGRAFLLCLVAEKGPDEAADYLRQLADEIEQLAEDEDAVRRPGGTGCPM